jgi:hypothetical protein
MGETNNLRPENNSFGQHSSPPETIRLRHNFGRKIRTTVVIFDSSVIGVVCDRRRKGSIPLEGM